MDINTNRIRDEMKNRNQWLCWEAAMRDGKETKLPKDPETEGFAQTDDPSTWGSFINANGKVRSGEMSGVGFVFTEDDNFVGIDLDDCRDPDTGEWEDWALDVMQDIGGWMEISPSGTGAHIILKGEIPGDRNRKGSIEIYEDGRFFTVTGQLVDEEGEPLNEDEDTPEIKEAQQALDAVYDRFLAEDDDTANETNVDVDSSQWGHLDLEDHGEESSAALSTGPNINDLDPSLREIINTAKSANNGYQFTQLWRGNWDSDYPSHSEADLAFCDMLAFWFSGDPERMDRVFRASGLMRPKWDDVRYSDGSTYGERTIEKAVATVDDHYDQEHYDDLVDESEQGTDTDQRLAPDNSGRGKQADSPSSDEQSESPPQDESSDPAQPSDQDSSSQSSGSNSTTQSDTASRGRGRRREGGRKRSPQRRSEIPDDVANSQSESTTAATSTSDTSPGDGGGWGDDSSTESPTELDVDGNPDTWEEDDSAFLNGSDDEEDEQDESGQNIEDELGISEEEAQASVEEMDKDDEASSSSSRDSEWTESSSSAQSDDRQSRSSTWEETGGQDSNGGLDDDRQAPETTVEVEADETSRNSEDPETELETDSSGGNGEDDEEEAEANTLEGLQERQADFEDEVRKRLNGLEDTTNQHGDKFNKKDTSPLRSDIEDNEAAISQLREDLDDTRSKFRGDIELEDDKLERICRELQRKEKTLEKREDQLQTMFQLFVLLCHAQPEQLFDRIESIFIAAGEVPKENIFEESIGEIISDYEREMEGGGMAEWEGGHSDTSGATSRTGRESDLGGRAANGSNEKRSSEGDNTEEDDGTFLSQFF